MNFVLKSFNHSESVRQFVFETIAADRSRSTVVVSADLAAVRDYGIAIQSLPLLCRQRLEVCDATTIATGSVTITRADMAAVSDAARQVLEERKPRRVRPPVSQAAVGSAWRQSSNPQPLPKG